MDNQEKVENVQNEESTELTVVEPKIVPQVASMWNNTKMFNLSYKMAGFLSQSDLIPPAYQNKIGNCLIALDISTRLGLSPMAVSIGTIIMAKMPQAKPML